MWCQDMENPNQNDSKDSFVDGHCGNDVGCGVSQQYHAEDTTEDNLCPSGKSVNKATTEDTTQSESDLSECDGLSVSKDIQLWPEDDCTYISNKQTCFHDQSESPDRLVPPVGDCANVEVEVVEDKVLEGPTNVVLITTNVSCNNDPQEELDSDVLDNNVPLAQTSESEMISEENDKEEVEDVSQVPEPCRNDSINVVDCSQQLVEQPDSSEKDESCNSKLDLDCKSNLQCERRELHTDNTKACSENYYNSLTANVLSDKACSPENSEQSLCLVNHVCCLGDEILHCANCSHCKRLVVRNSAASAIDEVLHLAAKHVAKVKFKNRNVNQEKENASSHDSDIKTLAKDEDSIKTVQGKSKMEKAVVQYVKPFDIGNSLLRQSANMGYCLSKSVPDLSLCKELIVQTDDQEFQSYIEAISGRYVSPLHNGSIVLSTHSNHLDYNNSHKADQSVSSVLTLMECDKKTHAHNSVEEQESVPMSKVECSETCLEDIRNEKEKCCILNTHMNFNVNEFDTPRLKGISDEGSSVSDLTFDSLDKNSEQQLPSSSLDVERGTSDQLNIEQKCCTPASENSNQKCWGLSKEKITSEPDESTPENAKLVIPELSAESKDLKDCLVNCEDTSIPEIGTQTQLDLSELNASAENLDSEDSKICEDSLIVYSPEAVDLRCSKNLPESCKKEDVHSYAVAPESPDDIVTNKTEPIVPKPEPLDEIKEENLENHPVNSEPEWGTSQTVAQTSSDKLSPTVSEEMSENLNTAVINITVSPPHDSGDHPDPSTNKEELIQVNVSAVGDVPASISHDESEQAVTKPCFSLEGLPSGTQADTLNCLVVKRSRRSVLSNDGLHSHEVCAPILEEDGEGGSTEDSELSPTASDSEGDLNMKLSKSSHDGTNSIGYLPLLEEDVNSRSTLSLISELDESCKDANLLEDQVEDDSLALLKTEDTMDRLNQTDIGTENSNSELTQRINGRRIKHLKEVVHEELMEEETPFTEYAEKMNEIRNVLKSNPTVKRLKELARSRGGLVTDEIRREAWPLLLGIDSASSKAPLAPMDSSELRSHPEYNQVVLDVNRSLRRFPSKISPEERLELQEQLTEIILRVLIKRRDLYYYQGYHDVAVTTLLVAGKDAAFHILEHISTAHLSDCMLPTMDRTVYLLNYIYPLLERINPHLAERLDRVEVGTMFCLPWFLTWYGYSLNRYEDVVRCFDYFMASPPLAPLYLAAVVVGRRSSEVLTADCDHATVHSLLSRIPDSLPLEELLAEASDLYHNYPPNLIESEVRERCERLRRIQEEEEERRQRMRQRRMLQRRHSMPAMAPRQLPGWYYFEHFLRYAPGGRFARLSATIMFGVIAWNLRNEMMRYF